MRALLLLLAISAFAGELDENILAAARAGDATQIKALLAKGADLNAKSPYGATPIFFAAGNGHLEAVKALVEKGAEINVQDTFYKMTPVGYAASKKHNEIVGYLFSKGATGADQLLAMSVQQKNADLLRIALGGKPSAEALSSALAAAERASQTDAVEMLKQAGAKPIEAVAVDPKVLESYTGRFRADIGEFIVTVKDGRLHAAFTGQPALALTARDNVTFVPDVVPAKFVFIVADGKATGIKFSQGGRDFNFERVNAQ